MEENDPAPLSNKKDNVLVKGKGKGKGKNVAAHVSSQVFTCSFTKASVQRTTAPAITVVGSPTATTPYHVAAPSYSGATIPSVYDMKKVVASDISTTSSERPSTLSLIENVDLGELIEDLMRTKVSLQPTATYKNS